MKRNLRVWALLAMSAIFLVVAVGASLNNLRRLQDSLDWVALTNDVLLEISNAETGLLHAESGERGYILSGDQSYLESYREGAADAVRSLGALVSRVADNPVQADRVRALRKVAIARLEEFREVVELGPGRRDEALVLLATVRSRRLTQQVRHMLLELRASEQTLLAERQRDVNRVAQQMTGLAAGMTILAVVTTALGAYFLQRQQAIARLHEANARTHELQSELLHMSRLSSMGEMASALAHELNQPLAALGSYLQGSRRLLESATDEKAVMVKDALGKAVAQTMRAGEIIRRLREFVARGETERRVESLRDIVDETISMVRLTAKDTSVDISSNIELRADAVLVDKVQIQQVLLNLMRNGIEAMKDSERRELSISSHRADGGLVAIEVADTGSGIPPEAAAKLFQPFVTTKVHGLGVGLSISRTIVESHGGQIEALPNEGGGTIFRFTIRSANEEEAAT